MPLNGLDGKYAGIGLSGVFLIVLLALATCLITYYFLRKKVARKVIIVALCLFLVGYGIGLFNFLRFPLAQGMDGPWYVTEVKNIVETGTSSIPAEPIVLYFASGASAFVNDATLGIKIAQAFFSALPVLTIWLLTFYITKSNFASFATALLMALSSMGIGIATVSLRNVGALAFLPLFYLFFFKFINREGREWTAKTLKIRGKKFGLTLDANLILSLLIFLVILGCHFLTAGLAVMTVVAYVAFFTGYRRKIPWRELKFVAVLGILVLVGMAASGTIRDRIINTSNAIAKSNPVPSDIFPFYAPQMPTAQGMGGAGGMDSGWTSLLFYLLALPAMWFSLRQSDRRYLLFTAAIPLILLCYQDWIVNLMYGFRFMIMIYIPLFVLVGVSIWYIRKGVPVWHFRKHSKEAAAVLLAFVVGFSFITMVGTWNAPAMGPYPITEETWSELSSISRQLPENSIVTTSEMGLYYWGPLVLDKVKDSTFFLAGVLNLNDLANQMRGTQEPGMVSLAVVENDLVAGENLESLGLELYDNVSYENAPHYRVLKLIENAGILDNCDNTGSFSSFDSGDAPGSLVSFSSLDSGDVLNNFTIQGSGPGGLPEYPGAVNLQWSKENIQENYFQGGRDLSSPEISAAVYSTTASYSEVLSWYENEMDNQGWTKFWENENPEWIWGEIQFSKGSNGAIIATYGSNWGQLIVVVEGPAEMFGWSTGPSGPFQEPETTNEIRFNHNPLFAFILLPIEFVQCLYGTAVYGVMKLVIAIPLSVGMIGFLIGLYPVLMSRYRKWGTAPRKASKTMVPPSLKQAVTVMRYELWKATKSRRLIWMLVLVVIFSAILAKAMEGAGSAIDFGKNFFASPACSLITVVGALLGGDILASEFERKTGYMLFANPIKRVTVVAGKFMSCFVSVLLAISIFYFAGAIFMLNTYGWVPATILGSFALAILYACAVLSLTFLLSSVLEVVSAMMLSLITLIAIMPMLQTLLLFKWGIEPWFLLPYASGTIGTFIDPPAQRIVSTPTGNYILPDFTLSVIVMLAYIFVSMILCIIATKRREMR